MPPIKPIIPRAAVPNFGDHFDAWNSSSTGHQRAENSPGASTGWRQLRTTKLHLQLREGSKSRGKGGTDQTARNLVAFDGKPNTLASNNAGENARVNTGVMLVEETRTNLVEEEKSRATKEVEGGLKVDEASSRKRGIFDGLVIYINGSTYPLISDHKLKYLLAENGARLSIHLGRRQVTHVILGKPSGNQGSGAGGGLAGSKIEKEVKRIRGCGIKYVGVEWVLESVKAGKRLSEAQFSNLKVAVYGQPSVYGMYKKTSSTMSAGETGPEVEDIP